MKKISILLGIIFLMSLHINAQCPTSTRSGVHVVQAKETLYRIAINYKVTVDEICEWNDINMTDPLSICKELVVKNPEFETKDSEPVTPTPQPQNNVAYYKQSGNKHVILPGQTIAGIAELYGYTEKKFREINSLVDKQELAAGSTLATTDCMCTDKDKEFEDKSNTPKPPSPSPTVATEAPYMKQAEMDMVNEINLLRANPSAYVVHINNYINQLKAKNSNPFSEELVNGLVTELKATPVLKKLQTISCMYSAAQKHGQDLKQSGTISHQGSDGKFPWERVTSNCQQMNDGKENLVGGVRSSREAIILLLLDAQSTTNEHRGNLLNPHWTHVVCYEIGNIGATPSCWIQQFGQSK